MPSHIATVLDPQGPDYATRDEREAYAAGLEAMAAWVRTTEFPIPRYTFEFSKYSPTLLITGANIADQDFVKRPGAAARLIGGRVDKTANYDGSYFQLTRDFGGGALMRYSVEREAVCEAVEETVLEEKLEPVDKLKLAELEGERQALMAAMDKVDEEHDALPAEKVAVPVTKVVYRCPPSLLQLSAQVNA